MTRAQIDRINSFSLFLKQHRITTLEIPATKTWQASIPKCPKTGRQRMSCREKTEWLAVRDLARKLGLIEIEKL